MTCLQHAFLAFSSRGWMLQDNTRNAVYCRSMVSKRWTEKVHCATAGIERVEGRKVVWRAPKIIFKNLSSLPKNLMGHLKRNEN